MQLLKKFFIMLFLLLAATFALLVIVGGGFGKKANLPVHLTDVSQTLVIAHRGAVHAAPENSFSALKFARSKGYTAVEVDIQISSDGKLFLFHDKETAHLLGVPGRATEKTLRTLQSTHLRWPDSTFSEPIISLEEAIDHFGKDFIFYLDIKRYSHHSFIEIAEKLNAFLAKHDIYNSVLISSGHFPFITYLEYQYPQIISCLEGFKPPAQHFFFWIPKHFRPDFIATFYHQIDDDYVSWLKESKMLNRYIAFTVKDEDGLAQIREWGIRKFIADDKPGLESKFMPGLEY